MKTFRLFGIEMPYWQDCEWCHKKDSCHFSSYAYLQPCNECRLTKKFTDQFTVKDTLGSMEHAFKVNKVAGVWEGEGRQVYTNYKGDVIDNIPYKRQRLGHKDWKK